MAADDNADRAYKTSRRAEVAANLDAIFAKQLERLEAEQELAAPSEQPAEPQATAPEAPAAPAAPQQAPAAEPQESAGVGETAMDVAKGVARGAPAFAADVIDNLGGLADEIGPYLGAPLFDLMNLGANGPQANVKNPFREASPSGAPSVRGMVDETLGKPETGAGQFAQDATGELIALVPVLRGLKHASMLKAGGQLFAADFAVTAAGSNKTDQTLSGQLADMTGLDGWFVDLIKNNPDDSTAERMIRTGLEGAFLGKALDKAVDAFKFAHSWVKGRTARNAIQDAAAEPIDGALEAAAADVAQTRAELEAVKAAQESFGEVAGASSAAQTAADEALRLEPIGLNRQPVMDASLAELDDASFEEIQRIAQERVDNLERLYDDNNIDPNADLQFKRDLIAAQDEYVAAELEAYRRKVNGMDAEDLAYELRQLASLKDKESKVQVLLVMDAVNRRGLTNELQPFMDQFAARSPTHAEALKGKLEDVKSTLKEAGVSGESAAPMLGEGASKVGAAVDSKVAQLEESVATAEAKLADVATKSPARGEVLENIRQELGAAPNGNPKDLDAALGRAADERLAAANAGAEVPPRVDLGAPTTTNHLQLRPEDVTRFRAAVINGDFEEASDAIANSFDNSNFDRIAESGDVTDMIAGVGHWISEHEKSLRLNYERTLDTTELKAKDELSRIADEYGLNPEDVAAKLQEQLPGQNLDVTLTAYRMTEVALVKKTQSIADVLAENPGDEIAQADFARYAILLANVNDRRAGVVAEIGRALSSLRLQVSAPGMDELLDAGRKLRMEQRRGVIDQHGGKDAILKLAEQVRMAPTQGAKRRIMRKSVDRLSNTIGDVGYAYVATNMLSAPPTHTTNVIGPLAKILLFDPAAGIGGGVVNALTGGGGAQLRRELHYFHAAWRNLAGVLGVDFATRNASPLRAGIRRAVREGRGQTIPDRAGKFLSSGEGNALRAVEIAKSARAGMPMHVPFSGLRSVGPARVQTLPSSVGKKLGDALDAQASGNLRLFGKPTGDPTKDIALGYGAAAKAIDYAGRIQSWPRHLIAGGDELVSGIGYRAKLEADAYAEARLRGLTGKDFQDFVDDLVDNSANWADIAKTADPKDLDAVARVELLSSMDKGAADFVREATFTQPPGFFTNELLMKAQRRMPALRWFTFFARTGANITRTAYNLSLPGSAQQLVTAKSREEASLAAAKVAINTGIVLKTFEALSEGRLTGSGPMNPAERDIWLLDHEPYSFWVDSLNDGKGGWVSYARLDPFATQVQVIAEFADALSYTDDAEGMEIANEILTRMGRLIGSKTYFQGISDFLGMLGGQTNPADVGLNLAKDFIPQSALLRNVRRGGILGVGADPAKPLVDKGQGFELNDAGISVPRREGTVAQWATELGSKVQAEVPNQLQDDWADLLNRVMDLKLDRRQFPQRDFFGNVTVYPPAYGPENFSGITQSAKGADPVVDELLAQDIGFNIKERMGITRGIELTPEQQDFKHRAFANPKGADSIRDLLAKVIAREDYQKAGSNVPGAKAKADRRKFLEKVIDRRVAAADRAVIEKFKEVKAQILANAEVADKMRTQQGSQEVQAEINSKKSALLKKLEDSLK